MSDCEQLELPRILPSQLPDLDFSTGLFGTLIDRARAAWNDDNVAEAPSCLYPLHPGV